MDSQGKLHFEENGACPIHGFFAHPGFPDPSHHDQLYVLLSTNGIGIGARTTHLSPRTEVGSCSNELVELDIIENLWWGEQTIIGLWGNTGVKKATWFSPSTSSTN